MGFVAEGVLRQTALGADSKIFAADEFGKSGFADYLNERIGGFERRPRQAADKGRENCFRAALPSTFAPKVPVCARGQTTRP